jgi:hypothetical protein
MILFVIGCMDYTIEDKSSTLPNQDMEDEVLVEDMTIAKAKIYANTSGDLYEIVPDDGYVNWIGSFFDDNGLVDHFEDIAIDLQGHMYGGTGDYLYLINPMTGEVEEQCPLEIDTTALTFTSDGSLIIGTENNLYILHLEDCSIDNLVSNSTHYTSGDIVGLPDGYLYWSVYGEESDLLVRVDPISGIEQSIGPIGTNRLYGMGFANEQLYGFASDGSIFRIDSLEAQSILASQHESLSWWGATTNPVLWD